MKSITWLLMARWHKEPGDSNCNCPVIPEYSDLGISTQLPLVPRPYMHQWTEHWFGTKPLPKPVLFYCQLDSWEQISVKFESEFYHFHSRKYISNCRLPKWRRFCPRGDDFKHRFGQIKISHSITLYVITYPCLWFFVWHASTNIYCGIFSKFQEHSGHFISQYTLGILRGGFSYHWPGLDSLWNLLIKESYGILHQKHTDRITKPFSFVHYFYVFKKYRWNDIWLIYHVHRIHNCGD